MLYTLDSMDDDHALDVKKSKSSSRCFRKERSVSLDWFAAARLVVLAKE